MKQMMATVALILALPGTAHAADPVKDYPLRPVRIVSGFQAGGSSDFLVRVLAPRLTERLGQSFVIENRPGAGGAIGANLVAKATPDGYHAHHLQRQPRCAGGATRACTRT